MKRYIDSDKANRAMREMFEQDCKEFGVEIPECFPATRAIEAIDNIQTADVEKVVYCKDCKNFIKYSSGNICEEYGGYVKENDFCSRCPDRDEKMDQEGEAEK